MPAPGSATFPDNVSMTSAQGPQKADVIMAFDDVSIDSVNVDQVNRSKGSASRWVPHVSGTGSLTSGSRVSGLTKKEKEERLAVYGLKLGLGRLGSLLSSTWFGSGSTGRLGELGCWVRSSAGRLRTSASWVGSRTW